MVGILERILYGNPNPQPTPTGGLLGFASSPLGMGVAQGLLTGTGNVATNIGTGLGLGQQYMQNQAKIDAIKSKSIGAKSVLGKLQEDYNAGIIDRDTYEAGLQRATSVYDPTTGNFVTYGGLKDTQNSTSQTIAPQSPISPEAQAWVAKNGIPQGREPSNIDAYNLFRDGLEGSSSGSIPTVSIPAGASPKTTQKAQEANVDLALEAAKRNLPVAKTAEVINKEKEKEFGQNALLTTANKYIKNLKEQIDAGAAIDENGNAISNYITSISGSNPQLPYGGGEISGFRSLGQSIGSKNQALRDTGDGLAVSLLQDVKQASGASAKQFDSNVDVKMMRSMIGDSGVSAQTKLRLLDNIASKYLGEKWPGIENIPMAKEIMQGKSSDNLTNVSPTGGSTYKKFNLPN